MSLISKFKQNENGTALLTAGALVATAGLAVVVYQQQKQISHLYQLSQLNAQVTLNLVNRVAAQAAIPLQNQ